MLDIKTPEVKIMLPSTNISTKNQSSSLKTIYLLLAFAGSIAPWFWFLQDSTALVSLPLFFQRAFANNIAVGLTSDLVISAIAFFSFVWIELKRMGVSRLWLLAYIGLTFAVGLSCALPCFLYYREQITERNISR
jgi:Terpene cyclase DEP1